MNGVAGAGLSRGQGENGEERGFQLYLPARPAFSSSSFPPLPSPPPLRPPLLSKKCHLLTSPSLPRSTLPNYPICDRPSPSSVSLVKWMDWRQKPSTRSRWNMIWKAKMKGTLSFPNPWFPNPITRIIPRLSAPTGNRCSDHCAFRRSGRV